MRPAAYSLTGNPRLRRKLPARKSPCAMMMGGAFRDASRLTPGRRASSAASCDHQSAVNNKYLH
ncbi:hypothetical protein KCP69_24885 [Salmonella enterica subsp. enterica]|nr:hypothetical protein KCP69_24885 [Salmonella enterica subsp. enterica]